MNSRSGQKKDAVVCKPRRSPLAIKRFTPSFNPWAGESRIVLGRPEILPAIRAKSSGYESEASLRIAHPPRKFQSVLQRLHTQILTLQLVATLVTFVPLPRYEGGKMADQEQFRKQIDRLAASRTLHGSESPLPLAAVPGATCHRSSWNASEGVPDRHRGVRPAKRLRSAVGLHHPGSGWTPSRQRCWSTTQAKGSTTRSWLSCRKAATSLLSIIECRLLPRQLGYRRWRRRRTPRLPEDGWRSRNRVGRVAGGCTRNDHLPRRNPQVDARPGCRSCTGRIPRVLGTLPLTPEDPWVESSNAEFVGRPETGMRYYNKARDGETALWDHYTGVGEVLSVHQLDQVFDSLHRHLRVKRGSLFSLDDAKNNDLIFVGSPSENLTLDEIPSTQEFVFQRVDSGPAKVPGPCRWSTYIPRRGAAALPCQPRKRAACGRLCGGRVHVGIESSTFGGGPGRHYNVRNASRGGICLPAGLRA